MSDNTKERPFVEVTSSKTPDQQKKPYIEMSNDELSNEFDYLADLADRYANNPFSNQDNLESVFNHITYVKYVLESRNQIQ
jgi:hypothetical protein